MLAELDGGRGHAPRRLDWQAYEAPQPPAYRTGLGSGSLKPNGGSAPAPLLSAAPCGGPAPASYATASTPAGPSFPVQVKVAQPVRGCGPPRRGASQASGPLPGPHFPLPGRADVWGAGYRSHREPGPVSKEEAAGGGRRGGYGPQVPLSQPPEEELERLTKKLVHDMNHPPSGEYFGRCGGCGEDVVGDGAGVVALDRVFHVACFVCSTCRAQLRGQHFYAVERRAYCESCYVATLEKCSTCSQPILDRILRAMGKAYHPGCFTCVVCHRGLDGIPFTVDATSQIHCIEDFHRNVDCCYPLRVSVRAATRWMGTSCARPAVPGASRNSLPRLPLTAESSQMYPLPSPFPSTTPISTFTTLSPNAVYSSSSHEIIIPQEFTKHT
ncbi:thyroid receptor-interacting protein 6 isoform X4 [Manis javanica]|nr:thyroid receptor-interacting protein 6 isoform X4 [Manis javanica]XP_036867751.1 thyroid receptor-interacting protein 6 isoform X4 [Manis javanica]